MTLTDRLSLEAPRSEPSDKDSRASGLGSEGEQSEVRQGWRVASRGRIACGGISFWPAAAHGGKVGSSGQRKPSAGEEKQVLARIQW